MVLAEPRPPGGGVGDDDQLGQFDGHRRIVTGVAPQVKHHVPEDSELRPLAADAAGLPPALAGAGGRPRVGNCE